MENNIELYLKESWSFIKQRCRFYFPYDKDSSELLFSQVLEKVWKNRDSFSGDSTDFKKWVNSVIRTTFIDDYRKEKKYRATDIESAYNVSEKSNPIENKNTKEIVDNLLLDIKSKFSSINYQAFDLYINGYKIHEISKMTDIPENTVKGIAHRIRKYINERYTINF